MNLIGSGDQVDEVVAIPAVEVNTSVLTSDERVVATTSDEPRGTVVYADVQNVGAVVAPDDVAPTRPVDILDRSERDRVPAAPNDPGVASGEVNVGRSKSLGLQRTLLEGKKK